MGKTYAYHRFSTDKQDAQSQINIITRCAESKHLNIDEIISDEAICGAVSYKRRNLSELLSRLEAGDTLIISEVSRLTRGGIVELSDIISNFFMARKIRLIVANVGLDVDCTDLTPMTKLQLAMMATFAEIERNNIKQRTKAALSARKQKIAEEGGFYSKSGNWCTSLGGTTTGQAKGGKANGEKRRKEAAENPTNRIVEAMTKDITNRSELDIVVIKLNEMGIRTSSGLEFNRNRLSALMSKIKNRKSTILKAP
jgi:DNA invertase Pin-like site-specific DNA recombinase